MATNQYVSATPDVLLSALRQAGAWVAAALISRGAITDGQTELIIGAVVGIGTLVWSLISSRHKTKKLNAAIAAPAGSPGTVK